MQWDACRQSGSCCLVYMQGSVLGHILFLLYTAKLFDVVIAECGFTGHTGLPQHTSLWPRRRNRRDGTPGKLHWADSQLGGRHQQSPETERGENSDHLAEISNWTNSVLKLWLFQKPQCSFQLLSNTTSRRCIGQSGGQSCCCTQPILFFLHPATRVNKAVTDTTSKWRH